MPVMTPDLLVMLSPEHREAWKRCQKATPGPWFIKDGELCANEMTISPSEQAEANMTFCAFARTDLPAALLELAQTKAELAELRAAMDAAPHDEECAYITAILMRDEGGRRIHATCDCWKAGLPK